MTSTSRQCMVTPIAVEHKKKGSCSLSDWGEQLDFEKNGKQMNWDGPVPSRGTMCAGDIAAIVYNPSIHREGKVLLYPITGTHNPTHRLPTWGDNIGQGDRDVLDLGTKICELDWETWLSLGGHRKVQGTALVASPHKILNHADRTPVKKEIARLGEIRDTLFNIISGSDLSATDNMIAHSLDKMYTLFGDSKEEAETELERRIAMLQMKQINLYASMEAATLLAESLMIKKEVISPEKKAAKEAIKAEKLAAKEAIKAEKLATKEALKAEKIAALVAIKVARKAAAFAEKEATKIETKIAKSQLKRIMCEITRLRKMYDPSVDGPRRYWNHEDGPDELEVAITHAEEIEERAGLKPSGVRSSL